MTVLSSSPWVITIDDFLSESESAIISDVITELQEMEMEEKMNRVDQSQNDNRMNSINNHNIYNRDSITDYYFSGWCMKTCMDTVSIFIMCAYLLFTSYSYILVFELNYMQFVFFYSMRLYTLRINEWHHWFSFRSTTLNIFW